MMQNEYLVKEEGNPKGDSPRVKNTVNNARKYKKYLLKINKKRERERIYK